MDISDGTCCGATQESYQEEGTKTEIEILKKKLIDAPCSCKKLRELGYELPWCVTLTADFNEIINDKPSLETLVNRLDMEDRLESA